MSTLRRTVLFLLSVALVFVCLTGCVASETEESDPGFSATISGTAPVLPGTPSPPKDTETESIVTEPTPTNTPLQSYPNNPWTLEKWVSDEYHERFVWTSEMGHEYNIPITFPAILPVDLFAVEFNESIIDYIGWKVEELQNCIEHRTDTYLLSISYEAYLNGDTLSIVLIEETSIDLTYYHVYNFDLEDREALTTADMCEEYLDLEYPQFLMISGEMILREFEDKFAHFKDNEPEYYEEIIDMVSIDTMSMNGRSLYLNENGQLILSYEAPSMAGAMYYPTIREFSLDGAVIPADEDAYSWFFDLASKTDGAYTTAYINMVKIAFDEDTEDFSEALTKRTDDEIRLIVAFLSIAYQEEPDLLRHMAAELEEQDIRDAILASLGTLS